MEYAWSLEMEIYTDGSCSPNPGNGGWGVVILRHGRSEPEEYSGRVRDTTNNRMELQAILEAVRRVPESGRARIHSDSALCVNVLSGHWKGKKNRDLIDEIRRLMESRHIEFKWVRGHNGDKWNEVADGLAKGRLAPKKGRRRNGAIVPTPD